MDKVVIKRGLNSVSEMLMERKGKEMGAILLILGIGLLVAAIGNGSFVMGVVGVILIVVGAVLFWQTSATKAYLDQNKKR